MKPMATEACAMSIRYSLFRPRTSASLGPEDSSTTGLGFGTSRLEAFHEPAGTLILGCAAMERRTLSTRAKSNCSPTDSRNSATGRSPLTNRASLGSVVHPSPAGKMRIDPLYGLTVPSCLYADCCTLFDSIVTDTRLPTRFRIRSIETTGFPSGFCETSMHVSFRDDLRSHEVNSASCTISEMTSPSNEPAITDHLPERASSLCS